MTETTTTDAELILRAAELMRSRAQAVIDDAADRDGPVWYRMDSREDAEHIAYMTPAFALAVAKWLRGCGAELARADDDCDDCDEPAGIRAARRVAFTYLERGVA